MIKWRHSWFPVWYGYCPTEKDFRKAMLQSTDPWTPWPTTSGCCVAYDDRIGDRRALVVINIDWAAEPAAGMGVLVHECVHVVEWMILTMADPSPSEEFRAYAMQAIFQELLNDISKYNNSAGAIGALPGS